MSWNLPESTHEFKFINVDVEFKQLSMCLARPNLDVFVFDSYLLHVGYKYLTNSLSHIINLSLCQEKCPSEWKIVLCTKPKGPLKTCAIPDQYIAIPQIPKVTVLENCAQHQLKEYLLTLFMLGKYRIRKSELHWFQSYLTNRKKLCL